MSFRTCKTIVYLRNTNEDIFDEIQELSVPPLVAYATKTFKPQKGSKDTIKLIQVTPVV